MCVGAELFSISKHPFQFTNSHPAVAAYTQKRLGTVKTWCYVWEIFRWKAQSDASAAMYCCVGPKTITSVQNAKAQ